MNPAASDGNSFPCGHPLYAGPPGHCVMCEVLNEDKVDAAQPTRVVNINKGAPCDVVVDRTTIWGNPYARGRMGGDSAARAEAIRLYEAWLRRQPNLMALIPTLRGKRLGCHCWPLPCHADVLARLADEEPMGPDTITVTPKPDDLDLSVLILDVETTGTNKETDQVIELCIQFGFGDFSRPGPSRTWLIKPKGGIPPEVSKIHGITDAHVADAPGFWQVAGDILAIIEGSQVLIGYNLPFDLEMIGAEVTRLGQAAPDWGGKIVVDAMQLWRSMEPRKLSDAHARFVGRPMANAHSAEADVRATGDIVLGMLEAWGLCGKDWGEIALLADPDRALWLGPSRHIQWRNNGTQIVFAFGKNNGRDVLTADVGFLRWVTEKDFPAHVKLICRAVNKARRECKEVEFITWAREQWPPPPEPEA